MRSVTGEAAASSSSVRQALVNAVTPISSQWLSASASSVQLADLSGRSRRRRSITAPSSVMRRRAGTDSATLPERALRIGIACGLPISCIRTRRCNRKGRRCLVTSSETRRVSAPVTGSVRRSSSASTVKRSTLTVSSPWSRVPASRAASIRASTRPRYSSKIAFCSAIGSARMRLSQRWMVGRLSVSPPSGFSSRRPVRSTKLPNVVACQRGALACRAAGDGCWRRSVRVAEAQ